MWQTGYEGRKEAGFLGATPVCAFQLSDIETVVNTFNNCAILYSSGKPHFSRLIVSKGMIYDVF